MHKELLSTAEMGQADRAAIAAGVDSLVLMEAAGAAVADAAVALLGDAAPSETCVATACGPGNNGGDGFVAARLLAQKGYVVRVGLLGGPDALQGDAKAMRAQWSGPVASMSPGFFDGAHVIIDAMFGAGLGRPLEGEAAAAAAAMNERRRQGAQLLAVDVPSGLDGTTGDAAGPVVEATATVTFFRLKPGHLLLPGRRLCGRVRLAPIPIPEAVLDAIGPTTFANTPSLWRGAFPVPDPDGHKYGRGHAVIVSGPPDATGAARLGARAALRAGAGLVTIIGNAAATAINAVHATSIMVHVAQGEAGLAAYLADARRNAVLVGPAAGIGPATVQAVGAILKSGAAAVLDADALTSFCSAPSETPAARGGFGFVARTEDAPPSPATLFGMIRTRTPPVVLTPHEGEFKRLFGALAGSKLDRAREAARRSGAIAILKGPDTVIAAPDGRAAINANAPPWLATAGSGDVLAGLVTGLLAQGMPPFEAAAAAVWLHGEAANQFGRGLIAEDLPEVLPRVLQHLFDDA